MKVPATAAVVGLGMWIGVVTLVDVIKALPAKIAAVRVQRGGE